MTTPEATVLFGAAVLAGGLNAVAGGGGFLALLLPMLFTNMPPLTTNAMIAVALWPGFLTSTVTSARPRLPRRNAAIWLLLAATIAGAVAGSQLMLHTPPVVFLHLVPLLILASTLLFAGSTRLMARQHAADHLPAGTGRVPPLTAVLLLGQLLIGGYGGYFGASLGLVLLASLSLAGMRNHHAIEGLALQLALINGGVTAVVYLLSDAVLWPQALVMIAGAVMGGWAGSRYGHRLAGHRLHQGLVTAGFAVGGYLFFKVYFFAS